MSKMVGAMVLLLPTSVAWALADEAAFAHIGKVRDAVDAAVDPSLDHLIDRLSAAPLSFTALDTTTVGKPSSHLTSPRTALPLRAANVQGLIPSRADASPSMRTRAVSVSAAEAHSLRTARTPTGSTQGQRRKTTQTLSQGTSASAPSLRSQGQPRKTAQTLSLGTRASAPSLRAPQQRAQTFSLGRTKTSARTVGFLRAGRDASTLPSTDEADQLLESLRLLNESLAHTWQPSLLQSCRSLASRAKQVTLGICATSVEAGVVNLKAWVADLGLPKGKLFGLDTKLLASRGPVCITYNSENGDAKISEYPGAFRGVVFTPTLTDGKFRQFGQLPLLQDGSFDGAFIA